jgi:hypothetical protein
MKRAIEISERIYRGMVKLYPATHRAEYGEEMARCFADLCRDGARRRGAAGLIAAWGLILRDFMGSLFREHRAEGRIVMGCLCEALRRKIASEKFVKDAAQALLFNGAGTLLVLSVLKLTSLPLTEGQLIIGLLAACAVSLQLVILGVLATPARVAPSEKQ